MPCSHALLAPSLASQLAPAAPLTPGSLRFCAGAPLAAGVVLASLLEAQQAQVLVGDGAHEQ